MTLRAPSAVNVYLALLAAGAAGGLAFSLEHWGAPERAGWLIPLLVLALLARAGPDVTVNHVDILLHSIVLLAAVPLVGPSGAIIVHAVSTAWRYRDRVSRIVFNVCSLVIGLVAGAVAAELLTGTLDGHAVPPGVLGIDLAIITTVIAVGNALTLAGILRLTEGTPMRSVLRLLAARIALGYIGYGIAAYLLVVLWSQAGLGWLSAVLLMPSLLVAQWGLLQYPREHRVYTGMLDGLVEALEMRSPGSRVHSRVASRVARSIAETLRLPETEVDTMSTAARLHDVGLLGLPPHVLRCEREATQDELLGLVDHPTASARMLGEVSFLQPSMPAVLSHHERYDGTGYPQGLAGEAIPLGARVVAVADAWTSFVLPRTGRPPMTPTQAVEECERLAGTALDPTCVEALRQVLARHPSTLEAPEVSLSTADHARGWHVVDQAHPAMTAEVARTARGQPC